MARDSLGICEQEWLLLDLLIQVHLFASVPEVRMVQIADHLECSNGTARKYTKLLEDKGLIEAVSKSPLRFTLTRSALHLLSLIPAPSCVDLDRV